MLRKYCHPFWVYCLVVGVPLSAAGGSSYLTTPRASAERAALKLFSEPLVPLGALPSEAESRALLHALETCPSRNAEPYLPLSEFLDRYPHSPYKASLLANLGRAYLDSSYYSKALDAFGAAWRLSKHAMEPRERGVADLAVGHLAELLSRTGRQEALEALLKELKPRTLHGSAGDRVHQAQASLRAMKEHPELALQCGPEALGAVLGVLKEGKADPRLEAYPSSPQGNSLAQMQVLAKGLGVDMVPARRNAGAEMVVPSMVHWKAGHFSAIVAERDQAYLVKNSSLDGGSWVGKEVFEKEGSGYALVAKAQIPSHGWSSLSGAEAALVWGTGYPRGPVDGNPPTRQNPCPKDTPLFESRRKVEAALSSSGLPECTVGVFPPHCDPRSKSARMAFYGMAANKVALIIKDPPVGYAPPRGPAIEFELSYDQKDISQPQTYSTSNLGPKWTHTFMRRMSVTVTAGTPNTYQWYRVLHGGGRILSGTQTGSTSPEFDWATPDKYQKTSLKFGRPDGQDTLWLKYPDGSVDTYGPDQVAEGYLLTSVADPAGNTVTLAYDATKRLTSITDALGQVTTLSYEGSDPLKITKVTDPFGRFATFQYNASGQLSSITDVIGIVSSFTYGPNAESPTAPADFINAMTTPYGTHTFAMGMNGVDRWLQATDPYGATERMEYRYSVGVASPPTVPVGSINNLITSMNTFYWDKRATALYPGDFNKAKIYHWLQTGYEGSASPILRSEKNPLESRVFYKYDNSATDYYELSNTLPLSTARILDDGSEQRSTYEYNAWGKVTKETDPSGRVTTWVFSPDGLDLLEVRNITGTNNDLLASFTYNTQHKPLTAKDAAGQTTTFTYNTWGQPTSITNPKNETTTLTYDGQGYLTQILGPLPGATTAFTYDTYGRLASVTPPGTGTTSYQYDALDRPTRVDFADGTYIANVYDRLDLRRARDRSGNWTLMTHNALGQLEEVQDVQGRVTHLGWCGCGTLESLRDPMGRITQWARDLQGRVVSKINDDWNRTNYLYDGAGRVIQRTDAKNQITNFAYFNDDNLKQVSYSNVLKATPTTSYTYDPIFNRVATITGPKGTSTFAYHPIGATPGLGAGRLSTVTNSRPNRNLTFGYDELGRVTTHAVNGLNQTRAFDALGRLTSASNPLGPFTYAYDGVTNRLSNIALPSGQNTQYTYFDNLGMNRLQTLQNRKGDGTTISKFDYAYDVEDRISAWTQQADAATPRVYGLSYDAVGQVLNATLHDGTITGTILKTYVFGYDDAGNRTSEQIDNQVTTADHNGLNQLIGTRTSLASAPIVKPVDTETSVRPKPGFRPSPLISSKRSPAKAPGLAH